MERVTLGQIKGLFIAGAAVVLASCTGSGTREGDLPDSAALAAPEAPAAALAPAQADSVTRAPGRAPAAGSTTPVGQTPARSEPVLKQPPPPRDTRPSIPWPPDTL